LKAGLAELLGHYPFLQLFTADALFTQRPLARAILDADRDFLLAVKDNQPSLLEAIQASFQEVVARPPDVETKEKKKARSTLASSGFSKARRSTTSRRDRLPRHQADLAGRFRCQPRGRYQADMRLATSSRASRPTR